ncbi:MAG: universal stress protein [Euryarchaeota archaeon]|nr:universal stress protein [Euryarchaeota archaeon]
MSWEVKKILVPTDGSPKAELAVEPALEIARLKGAEIVALSVLAAPFESSCFTGTGAAEGAQVIEELKVELAQKSAERVVARAEEAGIKARAVVLSGSPAEEILKVAEREDVDLIVMGTKGMTGTRRLLGSVAMSVISHAPCPVLTVREKEYSLPLYERARRM